MEHSEQQHRFRHGSTQSVLLGSVMLMALAGSAIGQDKPIAPTYPKFQTLRFEEDWSGFSPEGGTDYWDQYKHMELNEDGSYWVGFGGELRYRSEQWQSFGFSQAASADDTFNLGRALIYTDWHFGENVRIFIEGESAFASDRDLPGSRRGLDVDMLDLQNAFADVIYPISGTGDKLTARIGRQGLLFGKQRLVSTLPWANTQRSWDGARIIYQTNGWRIDSFYTRYTPVKKYQVNDWMAGPDFWGVYATGKLGSDNEIGIDVYYLGLETSGAVTFNGTSGTETRHTFGSRLFGSFGDTKIGYDVEGAYQFGDVGSADISAFMVASQFSYAFPDATWKPKVYVGFDYASGDDSAGDGNVETFNQLFPLGHAYNGYMDFIGRQNITDISAGVSFKPHQKLLLKADVHNFTRSSDSDSVYNAGGGILRATAAGASSDVGQEVDLTAKYSVDRHTTLQVGYSHFFTGDYFADTGTSEDVDFLYFQALYRF
ncbi:MAG TPA: hypothetical protein ENJ00_09530 [Phycisphaerales bacterium]|nr:hypothetical protein [Phycisphaerales bacterium]